MALLPTNSKFEKWLPGPTDRVFITGTTGSGKSTFAFWLLSEAANFNEMPWVIVDSKMDEPLVTRLLELKLAKLIHVKDEPPTAPGIYVLRPHDTELEELSTFMRKIWRKGRCGLWLDELYQIPDFKGEKGTGGALKSILTQGRSKQIPVYGLSQRPVDINLAMISEAQYIAMFRLKKKEDYERVVSYIPDDAKIFYDTKRIENRYCKWYDDVHNWSVMLRPCPPPDIIIGTIESRVAEMERRRRI